MAKKTQTNKPRIFISHAWEDKLLVRRLETELSAAGAEVWVDHLGIRGGDNLPKRISDALEWCNTLLLLWSDAALDSHWVELEWTNAVALEKAIIPCRLGTAKLPAILAHKAYLDFCNIDQGITQLLHALNLALQSKVPVSAKPTEQVAQIIHNQLLEKARPTKPKPPQTLLRSQPLNNLSIDDVKKMLKERGFFDRDWNKDGLGLVHQYKQKTIDGDPIVIDNTTSLMWQQSGSLKVVTHIYAENHIRELNAKRFAGYSDWRLPTLEEAMSLMEAKRHDQLYLDPIFDRRQTVIWTTDKQSKSAAWLVVFVEGKCLHADVENLSYMRVVR
jgi:hypothetical protein